VLKIEDISDFDTIKQVAVLLEKENARLHKRLAALVKELAAAKGQQGSKQLELELVKLQEQMALMQQRMFAASSERRKGSDDNNTDKDSDKKDKKRLGHGPRKQPDLPVQENLIDLDPEQQVCDVCGELLSEFKGQFEEADEITVVKRQFILLRHKRKKYRCRCNAKVRTALPPPRLIVGGRYSIDFAVEVACSKYLDHLPLARQVKMMAREGLKVDTQTLWDQIEALATHLQPSYEALPDYVLSKPVVHADETPWPLLSKGGKKRWYAWCAAVPDAVVYRIMKGRSTEEARKLLGGYKGVVVVDGYQAYNKLARDGPGEFVLSYCWAHVRRKFVEAEKFYPRAGAEILDLIGQLFAVERQAPDHVCVEGEQRQKALAQRHRLRQEISRPLLDQILHWSGQQEALPQSTLRRAIKYMINLWKGLTRFVDDPQIPIHNNLAEREMRRPVLGRKNHYGSRSKRGTEVSALFYSLLESAQLAGREPKAYLSRAAYMAIKSPGAVILPHQLQDK
jgi:transposase